MMDKILEVVAQYGPFPVGIMVGIWLSRWANAQLFNLMRRENDALRQEKKELLELIQAKETRIDLLHDKYLPKE